MDEATLQYSVPFYSSRNRRKQAGNLGTTGMQKRQRRLGADKEMIDPERGASRLFIFFLHVSLLWLSKTTPHQRRRARKSVTFYFSIIARKAHLPTRRYYVLSHIISLSPHGSFVCFVSGACRLANANNKCDAKRLLFWRVTRQVTGKFASERGITFAISDTDLHFWHCPPWCWAAESEKPLWQTTQL